MAHALPYTTYLLLALSDLRYLYQVKVSAEIYFDVLRGFPSGLDLLEYYTIQALYPDLYYLQFTACFMIFLAFLP